MYKVLQENNIEIKQDTNVIFTDSSWNDCVDTGRSTGGYVAMSQAGPVDYGSHLPVPVAMSSGEAEYIAAAVACMRASHICMIIYDLRCLGSKEYNSYELTCEPSIIIVDYEAAITMVKCNKDTAGNYHVARRFYYVHQGSTLKEHTFEWISTKYQLAESLTKPGTISTFGFLWSLLLTEIGNEN